MSSITAERLARVVVPESEFRRRRVQRDEERSHQGYLTPYHFQKAPVFKLVLRKRTRRKLPAFFAREHAEVLTVRTRLRFSAATPRTDTLDDPLSDAAGSLIVAMNAIGTWTKEKRTIQDELVSRLKGENYYFFRGNLSTYPIYITGGSILYKVPGNKKGHLARFRNKTIRLLRIGYGGSYGTGYFAANVFTFSKPKGETR